MAVLVASENALCGAGNGPSCDDRCRGEVEPRPRRRASLRVQACLRVFNHFHEDSTTYEMFSRRGGLAGFCGFCGSVSAMTC